jgi:hypothetical protein
MYAWLTPWIYVLVVGALYYWLGAQREQARLWLRENINMWLAQGLVLAVLGVAGVLFYRARWLHVLTWVAWAVAVVWTIHRCVTYTEEPPAENPLGGELPPPEKRAPRR